MARGAQGEQMSKEPRWPRKELRPGDNVCAFCTSYLDVGLDYTRLLTECRCCGDWNFCHVVVTIYKKPKTIAAKRPGVSWAL